MRVKGEIAWCSVSCLCERCLAEDGRLCFLTTNNFVLDVRFSS